MGFTAKALTVPTPTELKLKCFDCLSPEEEVDLEGTWKPNESFLGKKVSKITDQIKESLLSAFGRKKKKKDKRDPEYEWEYANFSSGDDGKWKKIIDDFSDMTFAERTQQLLKRFGFERSDLVEKE
ncbi:hypothetical protein AB6A40_000624 [Gnathostoma spinigerum]|uniref:Uncharacterized protein n=1 Tax=Gnathostoma spinigerum TaxID=75299 RepID=A0ABD6E3F8_9BILA